MWISIIIAAVLFSVCEMLFYINKEERTDRERWFVGRTHKGNDDRIIYVKYIPVKNERKKKEIYTDHIEYADVAEDAWIL